MHRFAKPLALRAASSSSSRSAALRRPLQQSLARSAVFFSSGGDAPRMGRRLTEEQLAERRAKRAERRAAKGEGAEEPSDALFIEGTVRPYQRHYVVMESHNDPSSWEPKLERSSEHLVGRYVRAIADYFDGNIRKSPLVVTAAMPFTGTCASEQPPVEEKKKPAEEGAHDILVFPEGLRVHNVVPSKISTLVTKSFEEGFDLRAVLQQENLEYSNVDEGVHIMVCAHGSRDERCGCKGPELLQWLKNLPAKEDLPLNLWTSSHYGGHRYAATCIVYPSGDWFGLLNEESSAKILMDAVADKDPLRIHEHWRGRLGLTSAQQFQAVKDKVQADAAIAKEA